MMRTKTIVLLSVIWCHLLTGCAIYVNTSPPFAESRSDKTKMLGSATVSLREGDKALEEATRIGTVGFLFPHTVKVGEILEAYAREYLGRAISKVSFGNSRQDGVLVSFEVNDFTISAMTTAASLELKMIVEDANGKRVLEKEYKGRGPGHGPFYTSTFDETRHVRQTTEEAYTKVFEQVLQDIQNLTLS